MSLNARSPSSTRAKFDEIPDGSHHQSDKTSGSPTITNDDSTSSISSSQSSTMRENFNANMKAYGRISPDCNDPYQDNISEKYHNKKGKVVLDDEKYADLKNSFSQFDTVIENPFGDKIFKMLKRDSTHSSNGNKNDSGASGFTQTKTT